MKIVRNIYDQIGLLLVIVVAVLFYQRKIILNWQTGIVIFLVICLIMLLGKVLPKYK